MNERTIVVKGTGSISVKPDLTIISMTLKTVTPDYKETMELAAKEVDGLRQALISIGYERETLKTTDFDIKTEYKSFQNEQKVWQQEFIGYSCTHSLKLEFDFDMKRLGETLTAISTCGSEPECHIVFSVKDKTTVSTELLENAVANATDKATILSRAAGVKLGAIQRIDYSWGELRLLSQTRYSHYQAYRKFEMVDVEPEDIHENDSVTVVWAIE